jgi:hypothetical protein
MRFIVPLSLVNVHSSSPYSTHNIRSFRHRKVSRALPEVPRFGLGGRTSIAATAEIIGLRT